MNQTIESLLSHRSIRKFNNQPISDEQRNVILDCARAASTSSFIQCTSVIRVVDQEKRRLLAEYAGGQPYVAEAAEFFVWCADFNRHLQIKPDAKLGFAEQTLIGAIDGALAAQNALAAAESLGLGGVYIGGLRNNPEKVSELLGLPMNVIPLFGLCLGHPAQNPEVKPRLPSSLYVHEDTYQLMDIDTLATYDQTIREYYRTRTGGNKEMSWSDQISGTLNKEARPFMKAFLESKGFSTR
ncbi:oxygen-insensitive NADPH nitroreductase [Enterovibrio norvegicus]|uniref:oxygen-insensitive NADPH nitroreductase n=1 Tax=Enterovibrio norvegicus TaxID=188144 RepID=UPI0010BE64C7|nr:oxygen-insensitive NADPH nitroreductase [Enterovibrio norvegicus]TKF27804.1 oxygen-insensitive NADPH nitroreductase [Enterovibrio norvegicus]